MNPIIRYLLAIPAGLAALVFVANAVHLAVILVSPDTALASMLAGVTGCLAFVFTAFKVAPEAINTWMSRGILTLAVLLGLTALAVGGSLATDTHHISSLGLFFSITAVGSAIKRRGQAVNGKRINTTT